jgi:hypothetical protein
MKAQPAEHLTAPKNGKLRSAFAFGAEFTARTSRSPSSEPR